MKTPYNRRVCAQPTSGALRRLAAASCLLALMIAPVRSAAPRVDAVEPPSWWAGHSLNPVRLLLRGTNLIGSRVLIDDPALRPGLTWVSPTGHYLMVDVHIAPDASPGARRLVVLAGDGSATAIEFEVLEPLPRAGRFQGITPDDVVYLIMPDRFANGDPANDDPSQAPGLHDRRQSRYYHGGDFRGIIDRLPYLQALGVTALWLNPWYDNVNQLNRRERYTADNRLDTNAGRAITDYHGYGSVDFYGVEEHFGTLETLRELVDAAHARGMKVIQDQVANHSGPYHPWVQNPPTPSWYNGSADAHRPNTWQTWTLPDPYAPPALQRDTLEGWFIDLLPDLNQNDPECAQYLIQNSLWWVGILGLDAIRQDTLPYVPRAFWRQWTAALRSEYPHLNVIGEMFDGDIAKVSFFQGGRPRFDGIDSGIHMLFDFPLFYPIRRVFAEGQPIRELPEQLARDHLYAHPDALLTFLGLHDVDRFMNVSGATPEGLKLAFTFLFTTRGTPLIYYGDELAMRGGRDPDNRRDFPGGWPDDPRNGFASSGRTPEEESVHQHVSALGQLRRQLEPLRRGRLITLAISDHAYVYARVTADESVLIALNNGRDSQTSTVDLNPLAAPPTASWSTRLGEASINLLDPHRVEITLPPWSGSIFTLPVRAR